LSRRKNIILLDPIAIQGDNVSATKMVPSGASAQYRALGVFLRPVFLSDNPFVDPLHFTGYFSVQDIDAYIRDLKQVGGM
jgi:hypothetical protein